MSQVMYSTHAGDPLLGDLVEVFVNELPNRVETLWDSLLKQDWELLSQSAHQLAGAAGTHGFPALTPVARELELAAQRQNLETFQTALAELDELCQSVRAGAGA